MVPRSHPIRLAFDEAAGRRDPNVTDVLDALEVPAAHRARFAQWAREVVKANAAGEYGVARRLAADAAADLKARLDADGWEPPRRRDDRSGDEIAEAVARRNR